GDPAGRDPGRGRHAAVGPVDRPQHGQGHHLHRPARGGGRGAVAGHGGRGRSGRGGLPGGSSLGGAVRRGGGAGVGGGQGGDRRWPGGRPGDRVEAGDQFVRRDFRHRGPEDRDAVVHRERSGEGQVHRQVTG